MKKIFFSFALIVFAASVNAQDIFHNTVRIEFEKTVYVKQLFKAIEPEWYEMIKDRVPETSITYFDFIGDSTHSLYKPGREVQYDPKSWFQGIADKNMVYNDYQTGT